MSRGNQQNYSYCSEKCCSHTCPQSTRLALLSLLFLSWCKTHDFPCTLLCFSLLDDTSNLFLNHCFGYSSCRWTQLHEIKFAGTSQVRVWPPHSHIEPLATPALSAWLSCVQHCYPGARGLQKGSQCTSPPWSKVLTRYEKGRSPGAVAMVMGKQQKGPASCLHLLPVQRDTDYYC